MTLTTPMLDKARSEELTSSKIEMALRELAKLNGSGDPPSVHSVYGHAPHWTFSWRLEWSRPFTRPLKWHRMVEDALVAEADELRRLIGEEHAAS